MKVFKEAMREWMVNYKANSVKPSTYDRLQTSYDLMCRYGISNIEIDDLTTLDLQQYLNALVRDRYALSTIKKQYHLISEFVDYANLSGILQKPLYKGVRLPSESAVKKHKREVTTYTKDEEKRLRQVLYRGDSPAYYAALIMLETGMRIGEVLALNWSDVDFRRRSVRINKTVVRISNGRRSYVQNAAKSHTSNRTIPLSREALRILEALYEKDDLKEFIIHNRHGGLLTYEAVRWWIRKACDEADVSYYGQHVFRHTFATNCYERGCDVKILSKLLGHSDVTITYNIYVHLFGEGLEEMRSVIG